MTLTCQLNRDNRELLFSDCNWHAYDVQNVKDLISSPESRRAWGSNLVSRPKKYGNPESRETFPSRIPLDFPLPSRIPINEKAKSRIPKNLLWTLCLDLKTINLTTICKLPNGDVPLEWVAFSVQMVYEWVVISWYFSIWGIWMGHDFSVWSIWHLLIILVFEVLSRICFSLTSKQEQGYRWGEKKTTTKLPWYMNGSIFHNLVYDWVYILRVWYMNGSQFHWNFGIWLTPILELQRHIPTKFNHYYPPGSIWFIN